MSIYRAEFPTLIRLPEVRVKDRAPLILLAWQLLALSGQVSAVILVRHGAPRGAAELLSNTSLALAYGSALWVLIRPQLSRVARNTAVVCLGVTPTLMWRATRPTLFTGFDEQLHMRTLADILASHQLFESNPLLEVSARYPGLETFTAFICNLGFPTMVAAMITILCARIILVTVLCSAVEYLTGSARGGGLAVAAYAVSPQFVFFNSQFSYQTLALPLGLSAMYLIARARKSQHPIPLLIGSTVCIAGLTITHHVTGFMTTLFLVIWAFAEKKPTRSRVTYGALAAVTIAVAWAMVQHSLLVDYLGPIANDVRAQFGGGARREVFQDSAGTGSAPVDRLLLLYYAAALSSLSLALAFFTLRWWRQGERNLLRWNPQFLTLLLTAAVPVFLAARVVPKGGELFDRSSSLLFFPLGLVVARYAVRLWWPNSDDSPTVAGRFSLPARSVAVVLASLMFLGGYVLGSGPNWARLPGPYMAAADTRSMDSETLAAVRWSKRNLEPGSRVGADRVSSVLLAAEAGLWPVMKGPGGVDVAALYVAQTWGMRQTDIAGSMRLRFLYVDRRLAAEKPPYGSYFFNGETGDGAQLSEAQLTKFDAVPTIKVVYRHGPVSIYDLGGLGLPELKSGWFKEPSTVATARHITAGFLFGLLFVWAIRRGWWARLRTKAGNFVGLTGKAAAAGVLVATISTMSAVLFTTGFTITPTFILPAVGVVALAYPRETRNAARRILSAVPWRTVGVVAAMTVPFVIVTAVAIHASISHDVDAVQHILQAPKAIHNPPASPNG